MEDIVVEQSLYDSMEGDIVADLKRAGDACFHILNPCPVPDEGLQRDFDLACYVSEELPERLFNTERRVLVLESGLGLSGCALLRRGLRLVTFVDPSADIVRSGTWKSVFLNAAEGMQHVKCFSSSGRPWHELGEEDLQQIRGGGAFDLVLLLLVDPASSSTGRPQSSSAEWAKVQWLLERTLIPGGTALVAYPSTHLGSPLAPVVRGLGAAAGLGSQQFERTTTTEEVAVRGCTAVVQLQRRPQN